MSELVFNLQFPKIWLKSGENWSWADQIFNNSTSFQTKSGIKDIRFILAQAPPTERAVEDFWQTVFHAEPALIFLLAPLYEEGGGCAFFLAQAGQYETYGQMMVTTKKAESFNYGTAYLFEVLPEACSNALFIRMIHCERWEPRITPSIRGFLPLMQMCRDIDVSQFFSMFLASKYSDLHADYE